MQTMLGTGSSATRPTKSFVRRFRTEILAHWRLAVRELPVARDIEAVALVDHIPDLLDEIARIAEEVGVEDVQESSFESARRHALDRLGEGFDIGAVVRELSLLRAAIHAVWRRENTEAQLELTAVDLAIDRAIAVSVAHYAEVHERTLAGIDRISTASFESSSVGELLQRLLTVFLETTPAVDTAAILLVEGDRLHLRAAVGLDVELERGFSLAVGEGFAGTVAAQRGPLELRSAYMDPLVKSETIRAKAVRALYGVPLVHDDQVIGVAHMGSVTAYEFSHEDRQFFASMAARATMGIVHHVLRHELATSEERFKKIAWERERALSKLESLLAASPVGIAFVDRDLRYLRINDALASVNGRPAAEHIGRTIHEVLPAAAPRLEPLLREVIESGQPVLNLEMDRESPTDPKERLALLTNYFPVRRAGQVTGVGAIVIDVTETKRAQEALRLEQARIQSILEHAPAAIWVKDHEGRVLLANHRLADALGHELGGVIGRSSDQLLPPEFAGDHTAHDQQVLRENRAVEVEEVVPSPTGPRTFLSIKFPLPGDPPLIGGIATEITQRKQMEQELRSEARAREEVLAVVSHDLRNPLGALEMAATILMSHLASDQRARRHLDTILRACTRMENLIDDLLDTANIRAGRLRLELERVRGETVVSEAVELQKPMAEEKGIALEYRPTGRTAELLCDRDRILQVFGNLIGNAIKFCRSGDTITVEDAYTDDHVVFSVRDSGPGISSDVLSHVFEAYWSGDSRRGTGLGLYISRGIVEAHGGRIWVESNPGEGATFLFSIPIVR